MKILITTDVFTPIVNGVVTSTLNLYEELEKAGHEVKILTIAPDHISRRIDNVYYIKSFQLNIYPNARGTVAFRDPCLKELLHWSPDVIHSQCEFFTFFFAARIAKKLNIPIVHTYHTLYEHYTDYFVKNETIGKKLVSVFSKFVLKHVSAVIAPTDKVKNSLIKYGVKQDINVIPTGIKLDQYRTDLTEGEKQQLKSQWGIPSENRIIATVGRLAAEKNIAEVLLYIQKLLDKYPQFTMLIVGDGPERANLEALAEKLNISEHVVFTGMVKPEEVKKYYQLADVFVNASQSETQGLTYIEALANGVPEVCKKDPCLLGVLTDGYNGFQYESGEQLVAYLFQLLTDDTLRMTMAKNARISAEQFGAPAFASTVARLYQQVVIKGATYEKEEKESDLEKAKRFSFV